MKKGAPITIKDLAAKLGVPPSTVGNVIRGDKRYNSKLRDRVMKAVKTYGYRRNIMASGLRGAKTNTVGILWSFGGFDVGEIISRLTQGCFQQGYTTMVSESMSDIRLIDEKLTDFRSRGVDKVVMQWASQENLPEHIIEKLSFFESLVVVSSIPVTFDCHNVVLSPREGIRGMVDAMVFAGSINPGVLISLNANKDKVNAWRERFLEHGVTIAEDFLIDIGSGRDAMRCYRYTETLEQRFPNGEFPFDSLFCGVDEAALAAIRWLRKYGYRIPEDVKISGFNNTEYAGEFTPPIASVGRSTAELICEILNLLFKEKEKGGKSFEQVLLNYKFFNRKSIQ